MWFPIRAPQPVEFVPRISPIGSVTKMMRLLYTAFAFGITGVLSGLYYRELTKAHDFHDRSASQLPLVHTHLLVLGFIFLLVVMALEKILGISAAAPRAFAWFYWFWTVGVAITGGMMLVTGTMVVLGSDGSSAALAGISGLGHIALTVALVLLFVALRAAVKKAGPVANRGLQGVEKA